MLMSGVVSAQGAPIVNESNGELGYEYSFTLPAARGRYQPQLSLRFSSSSRANRGAGLGWELTTSYVELDYHGSRWLHANGGRELLIPQDGATQDVQTFAFAIQRVPFKRIAHEKSANRWVIQDGQNTTYTFDRQCGRRWLLTRVVDAFGNDTVLRHGTCEEGLTQILYNRWAGSGGEYEYANSVVLEREHDDHGSIENWSGLVVDVQHRLKRVLVTGPVKAGTEPIVFRSYELQYDRDPALRSVLTRVTEHGGDVRDPARRLPRPPTVFTYEFNRGPAFQDRVPLQYGQPWDTYPGGRPAMDTATWVDVDRDGWLDLLWHDAAYGARWARNVSTPTRDPADPLKLARFNLLFSEPQNLRAVPISSSEPITQTVVDFDGDGILDIVRSSSSDCNSDDYLEVRLGSVDQNHVWSGRKVCIFAPAVFAAFDAAYPERSGHYPLNSRRLGLIDVNGDGLLDFVVDPTVVDTDDESSSNPPASAVDCSAFGWSPCAFQVFMNQRVGASSFTFQAAFAASWVPGRSHQLAYESSITEEWLPSLSNHNADALLDDGYTHQDGSGWSYIGGHDERGYLLTGMQEEALFPSHYVLNAFASGGGDIGRLPLELANLAGPRYEIVKLDGEACDASGGYCQPCSIFPADTRRALWTIVDANNDGLLDRLDHVAPGMWRVRWNSVRDFSSSTDLVAPCGSAPGCPDLYPEMSENSVRVNLGYGCVASIDDSTDDRGNLIDVNGDGALDYLWWDYTDGTSVTAHFFEGVAPLEGGASFVLRSVTTPSGATYSMRYARADEYGYDPVGGLRSVVVEVAVGGPLIPANSLHYQYANPASGPALNGEAGVQSRGFKDSWSRDLASGIVQHTTWATESAVVVGVPLGVILGRAVSDDPAGDLFAMRWWFRSTGTEYGQKSPTGSACVPPTDNTSYPVMLVAKTTTDIIDLGRPGYYELGSAAIDEFGVLTTSVRCEDVDQFGNANVVTKTSQLGTGSTGTGIVVERLASGTTSCLGLSQTVEVRTRALNAAGPVYGRAVSVYTDACQLSQTYALDAADGTARVTSRSYNYYDGLGNPVMSRTGPMFKVLVYDEAGLRVEQEKLSDAGRTLTTDYQYDIHTGLKTRARGPYVGTDEAAAVGAPARYYIYDLLGRLVATTKAAPDAYGPKTHVPPASAIDVPVEAYAYVDAAGGQPSRTLAYRFGSEKAGLPLAALSNPTAPELQDALLAVTYSDPLGRILQKRERVNAASGQYRVTGATVFDAAGRTPVTFDPFFDTGPEYEDYRDGVGGGRGTIITFDEQGRVTCSSYQYIPGAPPMSQATCESDSSDTPSFRLATATSYAFTRVPGRGPHSGYFFAVMTTPPELNLTAGTNRGQFTTLIGPSGEELGAIDPGGNRTWVERDPLGREIASWREGGGLSTPRPPDNVWGEPRSQQTPHAASWTNYNTAGQVHETWDANAPTIVKRREYDEAGRLLSLTVDSVTGDRIEYGYALGRLVETWEVTFDGGVMTRTLSGRNHYDLPFVAPGAEYAHTAGKLSWTENGETTIAYSYDEAGRPVRRDQFFDKLAMGKRFTTESTYEVDGRVIDVRFAGPTEYAPAFSHTVEYDSGGRPIRLAGGLAGADPTDYWKAIAPNGQPGPDAYDAVGRIRTIHADNGMVRTIREYHPTSGRLKDDWKSFGGTGNIFRMSTVDYEGTKLKRFTDSTDPASKTKYEYSYSPDGKLEVASAIPEPVGSFGALTQNYRQTFDFSGIGNISSVRDEQNVWATPGMSMRVDDQVYVYDKPAPGQATDKLLRVEAFATLNGAPTPAHASGAKQFKYDLHDRLTYVKSADGEESLCYGASGELLYRNVNGMLVFYVGPYATVTASPRPTVDVHVLLAGARIASVTPVRTLYYYRSRGGSIVATSVAGGELGARYQYDVYGGLLTPSSEISSSATRSELGYSSGLRLSGGLLYFKARVYDTQARQFVQPDVLDRQRYTYGRGDPVNWSDPSGRMSIYVDGYPMPSGSAGERWYSNKYGDLRGAMMEGINRSELDGAFRQAHGLPTIEHARAAAEASNGTAGSGTQEDEASKKDRAARALNVAPSEIAAIISHPDGALSVVTIQGVYTLTPDNQVSAFYGTAWITGDGVSCFAQLKYRTVDNMFARWVGATHSFWYVQGSDGKQHVLSGGPSVTKPQLLKAWPSEDVRSRVDNVTASTWFDSGCAPGHCAGVDRMVEATGSFNQQFAGTLYDPRHGPNSNTVARYLGNIGNFEPSGPPGSEYGWGTPWP
jgi:RHS repeat-associated protein